MSSTYIYLIIFGCVGYLIATDESVAKAVFYIAKIIQIKFEIFKWWLVHNPKTPWARYSMHRRSMKMAEELMKEFEEKNR
jgi:hypothetical protein